MEQEAVAKASPALPTIVSLEERAGRQGGAPSALLQPFHPHGSHYGVYCFAVARLLRPSPSHSTSIAWSGCHRGRLLHPWNPHPRGRCWFLSNGISVSFFRFLLFLLALSYHRDGLVGWEYVGALPSLVTLFVLLFFVSSPLRLSRPWQRYFVTAKTHYSLHAGTSKKMWSPTKIVVDSLVVVVAVVADFHTGTNVRGASPLWPSTSLIYLQSEDAEAVWRR